LLVNSTLPLAALHDNLLAPVAEMVRKVRCSSKLELEDLGDVASGNFHVTVPIILVQGTEEDFGAFIS